MEFEKLILSQIKDIPKWKVYRAGWRDCLSEVIKLMDEEINKKNPINENEVKYLKGEIKKLDLK